MKVHTLVRHSGRLAYLLAFLAALTVVHGLVFLTFARGEDIVYPGKPLASDPFYGQDSLFPDSDLTGNTVTVNGGPTIDGYVFGGIDYTESVYNNQVTITNGDIGIDVAGGASNSGSVYGNTVTFNSGSVGDDVHGGYSTTGSVYSNTVTFNDGSVGDNLNGGYSDGGGEVYGNTVVVNDGSVAGFINGGRSDTGDSHDNTVTVHDGNHGGVYSSYSYSSGNVDRGTVNIYGGTFDNSVAGGRSDGSSNVADSVTNIYGGNYTASGQSVYSGRSITGDVSGNTLNVSAGTFGATTYLYGARSNDGSSGGGDATSNTVNISGDATTIAAGVYGADTDGGVATGNTVNIDGGSITGAAIGGSTEAGVASGNAVNVSGGTVGGGLYGADSTSGAVSNNTVTVTAGDISGDVMGAYSTGAATGNAVTLSGGSFQGDVYGADAGAAAASGNTVTLIGSTLSFGNNSSLYGGFTTTGGASSGNLLSVQGFSGSFQNIDYFQQYEFLMPADLTPGSPMLSVANQVDLTDVTSVTVLGMEGGGYIPQTGDTFVLIDSTTNSFVPANDFTLKKGSFLLYPADWRTDTNDRLIVEILGSASSDPGTKGMNNGKLAGLMLSRQGGDLLVDAGIGNAVAERKVRNDCLPVVFAAMGGGHSRYDTGHLDMNSFGVLTGLAWGSSLPSARLTYGPFLEYGFGHYDSDNRFSTGRAKGKGDVRYLGGGLMGRLDLANGFHIEASGRIGSSRTEYHSRDLTTASGAGVRYDSRVLYAGIHAGVGYFHELGDRVGLKLYSKYMWTHQDSDRLDVQGEPVHFDAANSHAWKTGARTSFRTTERASLYAGAAYEYEFNAKATGSVYGVPLNPSKLKGSTGIFELGVTARPTPDSPVGVDVGVQAYVGKRKGVSGSVWLKYDF